MRKHMFSTRLHLPLALVLAATVFGSAQDSKQQPQGTASGGLRAFIDPATGAFREPEPGEASLGAAAPAAFAVEQPITSPTGAQGMILGEDQMTYSIATVGPDGKVKIGETTGKTNAEAIVLAAPTGKEPTDDR